MTVNVLTRRLWWNLGLLGLVAGLIVAALVEPGRKPVALAQPLLDLAPEQIERIVVERAGQETLTFERRDGRWWMVEPVDGPANPVLLTPILQLAGMRCPLRYAAAGLNLQALHLDPPRLRLWLNGREIRFGATAPTDGQRYLHIDAAVHLCPDRLYPLLTSAAGGFLAPSIEIPLPVAGSGE